MQQGDYPSSYSSSSSYYQYSHLPPNPTPIPTDPSPHPNPNPNLVPYASAPPFSDYSPDYHQPYPHPAPDPIPPSPTAPASSFPPFDSHAPPPYHQPPPPPPPPHPHPHTQPHQQSYYSPTPSFDRPHQPAVPPAPYSIAPDPVPNSTSAPPFPAPIYSAPAPSSYGPPAPTYDPQFENVAKYEQFYGGGYDRSGSGGLSDYGAVVYGKRPDLGGYDSRRDDGYGDGVYAYQGGKTEPYGARGTAPKLWSGSSGSGLMFDDYGRPIGSGGGAGGKDNSFGGGGAAKIVRAVPKADSRDDEKGAGVQKFRVKLLAESGGQSTMDVLCQIGLDGIRMLDPSTSRTLRIYPLENITRCEIIDSSIFAFWSKSPVDIEPRRIRLQSNRYTTSTILDTVTAATVQLKEMGGVSRPSDISKANEQPAERRRGFTDWMNIIKPGNEEKDHWVPDEAVNKCTACGADFNAFIRKHHCRNCGDIFCDKCTHGRIALTAEENAQPVRVCDRCLAEVTQRLSSAKEAASKPAALHSHEDLAKKLKEEMEKNRRGSGSQSNGSGKRMKEVACPICTVHLQVQVPSSGSETIECGVCQHPFLRAGFCRPVSTVSYLTP
ncbi:hypothetical protein MLD38_012845 [Melastoma candidum]|uniref:Uncharacterized protein n=1 Tax=Melastoma candidum TaxID=119954 RepID=A0ACB9R7M5_9MYRT|nr:hypothetical protein MLD38_012845 [Melastoma candidum]